MKEKDVFNALLFFTVYRKGLLIQFFLIRSCSFGETSQTKRRTLRSECCAAMFPFRLFGIVVFSQDMLSLTYKWGFNVGQKFELSKRISLRKQLYIRKYCLINMMSVRNPNWLSWQTKSRNYFLLKNILTFAYCVSCVTVTCKFKLKIVTKCVGSDSAK